MKSWIRYWCHNFGIGGKSLVWCPFLQTNADKKCNRSNIHRWGIINKWNIVYDINVGVGIGRAATKSIFGLIYWPKYRSGGRLLLELVLVAKLWSGIWQTKGDSLMWDCLQEKCLTNKTSITQDLWYTYWLREIKAKEVCILAISLSDIHKFQNMFSDTARIHDPRRHWCFGEMLLSGQR